jgi:hypothetical protein
MSPQDDTPTHDGREIETLEFARCDDVAEFDALRGDPAIPLGFWQTVRRSVATKLWFEVVRPRFGIGTHGLLAFARRAVT